MTFDRRKKTCGNCDCIIHRNKRMFMPEDIYCTVCQEPLVYACKRCGEIFVSSGMDDMYCNQCAAVLKARRERQEEYVDKALKAVGDVASVADVIAGAPSKAILKMSSKLRKR